MSNNLERIVKDETFVYANIEFIPKDTLFSPPPKDKSTVKVTFYFSGFSPSVEERRKFLSSYSTQIRDYAKEFGLNPSMSVHEDSLSTGFHPYISIEDLPVNMKSVEFLKEVQRIIGFDIKYKKI